MLLQFALKRSKIRFLAPRRGDFWGLGTLATNPPLFRNELCGLMMSTFSYVYLNLRSDKIRVEPYFVFNKIEIRDPCFAFITVEKTNFLKTFTMIRNTLKRSKIMFFSAGGEFFL